MSNLQISQKKSGRRVKVLIWIMLLVTVLGFPKPIGFETRQQNNVSLWWLLLFLSITGLEIATLILISKNPALAARTAIAAGILNIFQALADQNHMMQPELASRGSVILEYTAQVTSLCLIYVAWKSSKVPIGRPS